MKPQTKNLDLRTNREQPGKYARMVILSTNHDGLEWRTEHGYTKVATGNHERSKTGKNVQIFSKLVSIVIE
jgi:hypothetical protein